MVVSPKPPYRALEAAERVPPWPDWRRARTWALVLALWTVPGLVSTTQVYFLQLRYEPISWADAALWQMPPWYYWALVTPIVLWLGRRFPLERGLWGRHAPIHLAANVALSIPHMLLAAATGFGIGLYQEWDKSFWTIVQKLYERNVHLDVLTYWGVLACGYAVSYYRKYRSQEVVATRLETELVKAQLQTLKMQLHPHFLFNTLHAIGVLIRKRDDKTALQMLTGVSELLRATLDIGGRQRSSLDRELELLDRYVNIERVRLGHRLTVDVDIEPSTRGALVPSLILQPIVENAVRHGVARREGPGSITVASRRAGDRLILEVLDDGVGLPPGWTLQSGAGVGLGNTRTRLEQLYPEDHRLVVRPRKGGGVEVIMAIPFQTAGDTFA